jgi:hypothetical protein
MTSGDVTVLHCDKGEVLPQGLLPETLIVHFYSIIQDFKRQLVMC